MQNFKAIERGILFLKIQVQVAVKMKGKIIMLHQNYAFLCALILFAELLIAKELRSVPEVTETTVLAHTKGSLHLMQQFGF